jgi:hypothetical protein
LNPRGVGHAGTVAAVADLMSSTQKRQERVKP